MGSLEAPSRPRHRAAVAAWCAGGALLALTVILSLLVGSNPIPPGDVIASLLGQGGAEVDYIVWAQRVPRTVAAIIVGAALAAAGCLIQAFTRNPLADTGILGVNAGAAFFVAVGIAFFGIVDPGAYVWLACIGAFALTIAVSLIGSSARSGTDPIRLTLAGVALGAVFAGATTGIALTHPDAFDRLRGWNAGSLLGRGFDVILPILPVILVGLVLALLAAPALNSLALGADVARSHGVDVRRSDLIVVTGTTLLAGGATALAGPIAFVGLMVPHIARWTLGTDQRRILAGSLVLGPILVLVADIVGRVAIAPSEMPAGIVTAFIGAPVLIALVRRRKATGL
ncbi:iron chelate uptake ABC transporter family permease subunit [Agromyces atrinae]|uniref:iron chelate uptake ABC transporter family permease subunit n=1 Tax=Agromyces atrinae TaxID=592376 RepID=UPI001F5A5854|nr:iron chelate uptake ABC transporter family permease subunit [Agromyces atrinae]MCI2958453.1 iron chelate uptake ABC transporter family permease subunit [Agromyces atrinae]